MRAAFSAIVGMVSVALVLQLVSVVAGNASMSGTQLVDTGLRRRSTTTANPSAPVAVIGAGFSGLTAALELRRLGYNVTVFERHDEVGGRARAFEVDGVSFDA